MSVLQNLDKTGVFGNTQNTGNNVLAQITPLKPENTALGKVAEFFGGKEVAQGIGQSIAFGESSKRQDEAVANASKMSDIILKKIIEKRALGEDTSHLTELLSDSNKELARVSGETMKVLNPNALTTKQVAGSALQLGATLASAGTYGKVVPARTLLQNAAETTVSSGLKAGAKELVTASVPSALGGIGTRTVGEGVKKGLISGAISGGAYGGVYGASDAMRNDKSTSDILSSTAMGVGAGAITGGAIGALVGGISGKINQASASNERTQGMRGLADSIKSGKATKEDKKIMEMVMDTSKEAQKDAYMNNRFTEQTALKPRTMLPSKSDERLANSVKGVVDPKKSIDWNLTALRKKVNETNTRVGGYVKTHKTPFNENQLISKLKSGKGDLNLIFASDKNAERLYDAAVEEFVKGVEKKDSFELFLRRQEWDNIPSVKKLIQSQSLGENAKREVVMTLRDMANQYIAETLPKNNPYRELLNREAYMLRAIENMRPRVSSGWTSAIGKSRINEFAQKYPIINPIAGGIGAGITVGLGLKSIGSTAVGSSLLKSTD